MCFQYLNGGINVGDRFATQIQIGGQLKSSQVQKLIDAINGSEMSLEWGGATIDEVDLSTKEDLLECVDGKTKTIILRDDERSWDIDLDDLEKILQKLNLCYLKNVDADHGYDGELKFWSPQDGLIEQITDSSGHTIATQEELKEILHLIYSSTMLSLSEQIQGKINQAIKKLERLTQEFAVPPFEIKG